MKTANAIKKLERAGFEVRHRGNFDFEADKGTQRITWIDHRGEVYSLYLLDLRFTDDPQSDYLAGAYPRSVKAAIESAERAIKQHKDEAPMIAQKQREASEKRTARSVGEMFRL